MTPTIRVQWLGLLAKLVTPGDPAKAFAAMEAFLPFLAEVPDAAFTTASLEHVAMAPRRLHIPDLSEVKGPLLGWWRENGPRRIALPAPAAEPAPSTSAEERAEVSRQIRELADSLAPVKPAKPAIRAHVLAPDTLAQMRAALQAAPAEGNA